MSASPLSAQDRARIGYWSRQCAALSAMAEEEISSIANMLRRIDARRPITMPRRLASPGAVRCENAAPAEAPAE